MATSGLKAVMVAAAAGNPTPPMQPMVIKYDVMDSTGNAADTVFRRVELLCADNQLLCPREVRSHHLRFSSCAPYWR